MTNEELAGAVESIATRRLFAINEEGYLREAAARLRTFPLLSKAHRRLANDSVDNESNILSKLKVAEDALGESKVAVCLTCDKKYFCGHGTDKFDPCCIYKDIDNALAAIRKEGGAK